jgi:hypothetical protein
LVPIPPELPLFERFHKLLSPSQRLIALFWGNVESGEFTKFGEKVWEKAWTKDPFVLAGRAFATIYDIWKNSSDRK